jgi:hypothetical protein
MSKQRRSRCDQNGSDAPRAAAARVDGRCLARPSETLPCGVPKPPEWTRGKLRGRTDILVRPGRTRMSEPRHSLLCRPTQPASSDANRDDRHLPHAGQFRARMCSSQHFSGSFLGTWHLFGALLIKLNTQKKAGCLSRNRHPAGVGIVNGRLTFRRVELRPRASGGAALAETMECDDARDAHTEQQHARGLGDDNKWLEGHVGVAVGANATERILLDIVRGIDTKGAG